MLSGFPLTSFLLAEVSPSAFSWLYTLVCAVVQKYHEMYFIYNYSHFLVYTHFAINVLFTHPENVKKLWNKNCAVHVNERNQKTKQNQVIT